MESSRIFVRGLPPSMKEAEMRQHFSSQSPITDAKFIPHRRIGYVGYKTPEAAAKAVKYFNRTFIRMSKINVELARPVDEMRSEAAGKRRRFGSEEAAEQRGRKLREEPAVEKLEKGAVGEKKSDPKFEAFLDTMKASSKGRTWANEDFEAEKVAATATKVLDEGMDEGESDDDYQHIGKKRKVTTGVNEDDDDDVDMEFQGFDDKKDAEQVPQDDDAMDDDAEATAADETPGEEVVTQVETAPPASDADWLRSRTSRVLDLLDDDDLEARAAPKAKPLSGTNIFQKPNEPEELPVVEPELIDAEAATPPEEASPPTPPNEPSLQLSERLFVRNLPYDASEQDLLAHFKAHGAISEIHISRDTKSGNSKGFGYISFEDPEHAESARQALDGKTFQGRLLHVIPAKVKQDRTLDDVALSKLPLKVQNQIKRKAGASSETFKWNSMFMSADAVVASAASRLGVSKADVLDPTSSDAAVKQAHAETNAINETKRHMESNGVDLDSFNPAKSGGFSDTAMLVKNFPFGTTAAEIRDLFGKYGNVKRIIVPPAGTIAIVEMEQATHARSAFKPLAYSKFKDTILYLEKAPKNVLKDNAPTLAQAGTLDKADVQKDTSAALQEFDKVDQGATTTLFVRNLNFSTTTDQLRDLFASLDGFLSAKVKTRTDVKKPGQLLSMGFGFVEFRSKSQAQAALAAMNGYRLAGHELTIRASHKAADAAEERRTDDREKKLASRSTKIIVKNLPFEATKHDIRALFSPYGKLRSVRVPKKFDSSSRGFAFADFVTTKEASNAMDALKETHLLGRRLVLSFAAADAIDPEDEIQRMQAKIEQQADKVAAQKLTSTGGRKKFRATGGDEGDDE